MSNVIEEDSVFSQEELGNKQQEDEFDDEEVSEGSSNTQSTSESVGDTDDDEYDIPNLQLIPIDPSEIDRKHVWEYTESDDPANFLDENGVGMPRPILISAGSLPMISPHQSEKNLKDPEFRIFNKSALEFYSEDIVRLLKLKIRLDEEEQNQKRKQIYEMEEERQAPNEQVAKILSSLGEVVERFRENLTNLYDPPMEGSRKQRRLTRKKSMLFKARGYKQMITVIEQYIRGLKLYGEYPEEMWTEFENAKIQALKSIADDDAILYGSQILVCADYVLGDEPEVRPVKRINEGIAQPSSQE